MYYDIINANTIIKVRNLNSDDLFMCIYEDKVVVSTSIYYEKDAVIRFILDSQDEISYWQKVISEKNKYLKSTQKKKIFAPDIYKVCRSCDYFGKENVANSNDRFAISFKQVISTYISNEIFRKIIDSGEYIYVDNNVCLNKATYINSRSGRLQMTDYGRSNKDECCLLYKMLTTKEMVKELEDKVPASIREGVSKAKDLAESMCKYHGDFTEIFRQMLDESGFSDKEVCIRSFIQRKTLERIKKGKNTTLQTLLALCCGMNLSVPQIELLLQKSGIFLRSEVEQDVAYKLLLPYCSTMSLEEINLVLFANRYDLWGSKIEISEYSEYLEGFLEK